MHPEKPTLSFRILRCLVFWAGDVRRIKTFPYVTWDVHQHEIDLGEVIREALPQLEPGDIILHRDAGFLSNLFIGGAMIHAGLYVGGGDVVEAVSEGVVKRHAAHILLSDRACILRPVFSDEVERSAAVSEALEWAERIVGFAYDVLFMFNGREAREKIRKYGPAARKMRVRFCCTEVPYFCYLDYVEKLQLQRRRNVGAVRTLLSLLGLHPGKTVIDADLYVRGRFELIWCSRLMTPQWCRRMRRDEQYLAKVEAWWQGQGRPKTAYVRSPA